MAAAYKRIAGLEAELALTRDACELFDDQVVAPPNADARSLKGPATPTVSLVGEDLSNMLP